MRKSVFLACMALLMALVWMPAYSADKPVHSMWSPTYQGATREELQQSAINFEKMEAEANSRKLVYSLVGLVGLFGAIVVVGLLRTRQQRIVAATDYAMIGTLAAVVSAKRTLRDKIEARIASKTKTTDD
ncbi:hypothetical protein NKI79_23050 [Mesorhizobium sp. M0340]|uniref:hypothetical protein n=1 Tax=Mesorhizobium sp. M0340 TaxID=2956939 RepID=UPI003339898B